MSGARRVAMPEPPSVVVVGPDVIESYSTIAAVPTARPAARRPPAKTPDDERVDALYGACRVCFHHPATPEEVLLLCDVCDRGFHLLCVKPALTRVPPGEWLCATCAAARRSARTARAAAVARMSTLFRHVDMLLSCPPRILMKCAPRKRAASARAARRARTFCAAGIEDDTIPPRPLELPLAPPVVPAKLAAKHQWADQQRCPAARVSRAHDRAVQFWLATQRLDCARLRNPPQQVSAGRIQKRSVS